MPGPKDEDKGVRSLLSQSCLAMRAPSQKLRRRTIKEDTQNLPLTSTCTFVGMYTYTYMDTYIQNVLILVIKLNLFSSMGLFGSDYATQKT